MSFFDKKEEVLDIQLTQYGKYLLSKGKFKAAYYAFFDDDLLYDSDYGGFEEERPNVSDRIRNETPSLKVQYVYGGVETNLKKLQKLRNSGNEIEPQQTPERFYALSAPLGNSSLTEENLPAWNVKTLNGEMSSNIRYRTGSFGTSRIPQIQLSDVVYTTNVEKPELGDDNQDPVFGDFGDPSENSVSDLNFATTRFEDGSYIKITDDYVLMQIDEENAPLLRENFDIEVFIEEEDDKTGELVLTPLSFEKRKSLIDENNILLDQKDLRPTENSILDPSFVEHFFNVYVDSEISKDVICKSLTPREREALFPNETFDCVDRKVNETLVTDVEGLYDSDVTIEDLDDEC